MRTTQIEFTQIARALQAECARHGLTAPAFRSPPKTVGESRTLRRCEGVVIVAVRLDLEPHEITKSMIDGVIAANRVEDPIAVETIRGALWEAAGLALAA